MSNNVIDYDYKLVVLGNPRAQGRPRARHAGRFIQIYDDPKSAKEKKKIEVIIQEQAPDKPLDCPLRVDLYFYLPRPKGHYGTGRNAGKLKASAPLNHTKKPDIDNLRKLIMDSLTGIFYRDDSLVCEGLTRKVYSDRPRIEIFIKKQND